MLSYWLPAITASPCKGADIGQAPEKSRFVRLRPQRRSRYREVTRRQAGGDAAPPSTSSSHAGHGFRLGDRGLEQNQPLGRADRRRAEQRQFRAPPLAAAATAADIVAIEIAVGTDHVESSSWPRRAPDPYYDRMNRSECHKHLQNTWRRENAPTQTQQLRFQIVLKQVGVCADDYIRWYLLSLSHCAIVCRGATFVPSRSIRGPAGRGGANPPARHSAWCPTGWRAPNRAFGGRG